MRAGLWYIHSWIPVRLSLGYPRETIIGFFGVFIHLFPLLLVAAAAFLTYNARKYRLLFFAHAFFFITLLPAIVRLGLGIGIFMSDRYVYLSVFGLIFLLTAWILTLQKAKPRVRQGILAGIAVIFAVISFNAARTWEDTESLWTNVIKKYPEVAYAHVNRGSFYREAGDYNRALADLNLAVELDDIANARIQRGLVHRQSGNAAAAIEDYNKALEHSPGDIQALVNRGNALLDTRRFREAISDFDKVLAEEPTNVRAATNRAIAFASLGDYANAEASFAQVEQYAGNNPDFYMNRAIMFVESRQYQKALADYGQYLFLKPGDHQIHYDKGIVHNLTGQYQKAVESFTNAININPDKLYYQSRARAYDALGNTAAAQQDRQRGQ
jgi:tetratricopeptide (TPR) repeat protein